MKKVILGLLLLTSSFSYAKGKIVVAVIDTGIAYNLRNSPMLCKTGHQDFTRPGVFPYDNHDHGSHISGLIDQFAKGFDLTANIHDIMNFNKHLETMKSMDIGYCQVILKYYDEQASGMVNLDRLVAAISKAIELKVDIINISGGGSHFFNREEKVIKEALDRGIKIVTAAGNEGVELGSKYVTKQGNTAWHTYYPAQYDIRIIVVGNWTQINRRAPSSNYGRFVNRWEVGNSMLSYKKTGDVGFMTGTSQATAVATGKLVRSLLAK